MTELKEIKESKEGKVLEPVKRLSPTSVNAWFKCPREFYYNYIEKQKVKPNIALVKGSVVHSVLENFYRGYKPNLKREIKRLFIKEWEKQKNLIKQLELNPINLIKEKRDAFRIVMGFYNKLKITLDILVKYGKAENERHAYYLTKPKLREMYIKNEDLHCSGFIDRIHEDFDGIVTLGDYKTSSKYGIGLNQSYKRQLGIYALLYENDTGRMPDFVSIIFLRYGEEFLLEVTPSLMKFARDTLQETWARTRSVDIKDYPLKEGKLCGWCNFQHICSGKEEIEKQKRLDKLKKLVEDDNNEKSKS